ncbi:hypothetical protein KEJ36_03720 [Candidatus Bathyarchaeota archaeon]|nr:hypothetical protein [Candidatus Bathyarchaeota archaeon]MBS7627908.1 hypothetical protein [Candidatus Bathyarchaeota archaeon]
MDRSFPIPSVRIGSKKVPRIILGCMPFLGESYQGQEKNLLYAQRFQEPKNLKGIILKGIFEYGITAMAAVPANTGFLATSLLKVVKEIEDFYRISLALAPCISLRLRLGSKPVDDYRRWVTYFHQASRNLEKEDFQGKERLLLKFLKDPILLTRPGWERRFPEALEGLSPYGKEESYSLDFDEASLREALKSLEGHEILFVEPGSETDFLVAMERFDLLEALMKLLRSLGFENILFGIHHAGRTIPALEASGLPFQGYVTPVNRIGALMLPSQEEALKAIKASSKPIVAIKPLAGGRIRPGEAFSYVFKDVGVDACMIGVASEEELDEDLEAALKFIN